MDGRAARSTLRKMSMRYNQALFRFETVGQLPARWQFDYDSHRFELVPLMYMAHTIVGYHNRANAIIESHLQQATLVDLNQCETLNPWTSRRFKQNVFAYATSLAQRRHSSAR